jgi:hypothetical protein
MRGMTTTNHLYLTFCLFLPFRRGCVLCHRLVFLVLVLLAMFRRPLLALLLQRLLIISIQIVRLDKEHADEERDPGARDHKIVDIADTLSCEEDKRK